MTRTHFRWLIIASFLASILGAVVSLAGESLLPEPLRSYLDGQFQGALTASEIALLVFGIPLIIVTIISLVGLFFFWKFARTLTVIDWVAGLVLQGFTGPTVDQGLATSFYELSALLAGVVLALAYVGPAKEWFEGDQKAAARKTFIVGGVSVAGIGMIVVMAFGIFVFYSSRPPAGVAVVVKSPEQVQVGETFELEVAVHNKRSGKVLKVSDVDIAEEYLGGFKVVSVQPAARDKGHVPLDDTHSFTFDLSVPSGMTRSFKFSLQAKKAGVFSGDIDVCEGSRFVTSTLETVVKE